MYCKLTDQNLQTYAGFQWVIGEWKETSGKGELCTKGWLHCYTHPLLAAFFNRIHAGIDNPRLFEIEVAGKIQEDCGLKVGFTKMRLMKEISFPQVTIIQKLAFGILCTKEVTTNEKWLEWAEKWLNNIDRTTKSAKDVYSAIAYSVIDRYCGFSSNRMDISIHAVEMSSSYYAACSAINTAYYAASFKPLNLIELAQKAMTYN